MNRKYLKEIGCKEDDWPETGYNNYRSPEEYDKRLIKSLKEQEKTGVNPIDTWNLDMVALMWLYERLITYLKVAGKVVDLDWNGQAFEIDGKQYTHRQVIELLISLGEFLITNPEKLAKHSKAYKKVTSNPYYVKYKEIEAAESVHSDSLNRDVSGLVAAEDYRFECNKKFWQIWAEVFPTMWW